MALTFGMWALFQGDLVYKNQVFKGNLLQKVRHLLSIQQSVSNICLGDVEGCLDTVGDQPPPLALDVLLQVNQEIVVIRVGVQNPLCDQPLLEFPAC